MFEGDEYTTLMTQCKEGSQRDGLMLDSTDELYKWFTNQVRNPNRVPLGGKWHFRMYIGDKKFARRFYDESIVGRSERSRGYVACAV